MEKKNSFGLKMTRISFSPRPSTIFHSLIWSKLSELSNFARFSTLQLQLFGFTFPQSKQTYLGKPKSEEEAVCDMSLQILKT
jgi:hypothetical protein